MHIINNAAAWEAGLLLKDIDAFKKNDPDFMICIVSQSSNQAVIINEDLIRRYPDLNIKILTDSDSGATKKELL